MKQVTILLVLGLLAFRSTAQVYPSDCTPPSLLQSEYQWDLKNLALREMIGLHSPDTALVHIPHAWVDTIEAGMAAIVNATSMPERDTLFNLYCVHDKAPNNIFIYKEIMVTVDTNYAWTHAWQNLVTITGNPQMDYLLTTYDLHIVAFYNWSFGEVALLGTDSLWNIYALMDSLGQVPGVVSSEPNGWIGTAGTITYSKSGANRFYDFTFEWNDCFDGCDNSSTWHFRVQSDCSVEYLGRTDWGVFGILPLPAPLNCNLFTGISDITLKSGDFQISPNPANNLITINFPEPISSDNTLTLYDISGKQLLSKQNINNKQTLDISKYSDGMYFIRLESGNEVRTHKLVICR